MIKGWEPASLSITARQYGEVVLPDASTGQGPGSLAANLSRCKEGMAHFLPSRYKICELYACRGTSLIGAANLSPVTNLMAGTGPEVSGVQFVSEPGICQGAGF